MLCRLWLHHFRLHRSDRFPFAVRTFLLVAGSQIGLLQSRILAGVRLRFSLRHRLARQRRNLLVHSGL